MLYFIFFLIFYLESLNYCLCKCEKKWMCSHIGCSTLISHLYIHIQESDGVLLYVNFNVTSQKNKQISQTTNHSRLTPTCTTYAETLDLRSECLTDGWPEAAFVGACGLWCGLVLSTAWCACR